MSVFRVKLQNMKQGTLDRIQTSQVEVGGTTPGVQQTVSIQRQVYVDGPKRNKMLLKDGATFTANNYWKKFAYPALPLEQAIIEVINDDGSVYSDIDSENVFPAVWTVSVADNTTVNSQTGSTVTYNGVTTNNSATIDILGTFGSAARFVQIVNKAATGQDIKVRLNGSSAAIITVLGGTTQVFDSGDLAVTSLLLFEGALSGAAAVEVLASIQAPSQPTGVKGQVFPLGNGTLA